MNRRDLFVYILLVITNIIFQLYIYFRAKSWDFIVYILNAKYFSGDYIFYETFRPPLISFFMALISIFFNWNLVPYMYITFCVILFSISSYFLAKELKFNPLIFYGISLTPFLLLEGLFNGTELLTFSLLQFFVFFILKNSYISGLFFGLMFLSRYTSILFFPLVFFITGIKNKFLTLFLSFIAILFWLIYNKIEFGSFLYSIADQYVQNISSRVYFDMGTNLVQLFFVFAFLLPVFIIGFVERIKSIIKNRSHNLEKRDLVFILILIISFYIYFMTPLKVQRYLFYLNISLFYFSYYGIKKVGIIFNNRFSDILIVFLILLSYITTFSMIPSYKGENINISLEQVGNCFIYTNNWPVLNYNNYLSGPLPEKEYFEYKIKNEDIIAVILENKGDYYYLSDSEFLNSLPLIYRGSQYQVYGNSIDKCEKREEFIFSYMEDTKEELNFLYLKNVNINPCFAIFNDFPFIEKTCNFFERGKFETDENRIGIK